MRQNPHVRICGGPGSATTLVYPTVSRVERSAPHVGTTLRSRKLDYQAGRSLTQGTSTGRLPSLALALIRHRTPLEVPRA